MELLINPVSWGLIKRGQKTIETRLGNDPVLSQVAVNDELVIVNRETGERLTRHVTGVRKYKSSEDVSLRESLDTLGSYASPDDYVARMRQFQSKADEAAAGVVAVELR